MPQQQLCKSLFFSSIICTLSNGMLTAQRLKVIQDVYLHVGVAKFREIECALCVGFPCLGLFLLLP